MIGGLLGWLFSLMTQLEAKVHPVLDPVIGVLLGAGSAYIFIFLIANTERTDTNRLVALALLAGFFWEPVWNMGGELIERRSDNRNALAAQAELSDVAILLTQYSQTSSGEEKKEIALKAKQELSSAAKRVESISDPKIRLAVLPIAAEATTKVWETQNLPDELKEKSWETLKSIDPSIIERVHGEEVTTFPGESPYGLKWLRATDNPTGTETPPSG